MGVARAYIDFDNLLPVFVEDCSVDLEAWLGIPQDAEILNGGYSEKRHAWFVDFEHPDYNDFDEFDVKLTGYYMEVAPPNVVKEEF